MSTKKKICISIFCILIILILALLALYITDIIRMSKNEPVLFSTWGKDYSPTTNPSSDNTSHNTQDNNDIQFVLTLDDNLSSNSIWCGTFQLIWNDLKNDLAKQDIIFTPQLQVVENLNKGQFDTSQISEQYYYKIYGHPSFTLKSEIEKAIKDKFNEDSEILDSFNWSNNPSDKDYILYAMLKKDFNFEVAFDELENSSFKDTNDVEYFGIMQNTNSELKDATKSQVEVLYYNNDNDFAIQLNTKENDNIILCKNPVGNTFNEIYQNISENSNKFTGKSSLSDIDELKIPNIDIDEKEEFKDLENKEFQFSNGDIYYIEKALQTIEFELDKNGGRIKSEAGMSIRNTAAMPKEEMPRKFYLDNTFTIFLKEKDKTLPYFAARIDDINKFQD